jgi:predicted dehydrogenase/nucleoside-diphosphate-sugar epimerase
MEWMTHVTAAVHPAAPLSVVIVGAGKMAAQHAGAIARLGGLARVIALADPLRTARANVRVHAPEAFGDRVPDVVHVCTPPASHAKLAAAALERGSHIYVEKPFAESLAPAERLLALAQAKGLLVCAGHQLLFERPAREALALLPALGQLVHMESYFSFRTVRRAPGGGAPMRADHQLLDILPHPVYLLLRFLESPRNRTEVAALDVGRTGTVHALLRNGDVTGSLIVTLEGRPIESYLRLVGTNGMLHADFVRGTVQRLFGPGTSAVDKLLAPYRLAWQGATGATASFATRLLRRQRSYPGLAELFEAFYRAILEGRASPISPQSILDTVAVCEQVAARISAPPIAQAIWDVRQPRSGPVAVTGGTGFLGQALVKRLLDRDAAVRVLCRRAPAPWARVPGAEYIELDLGNPVPPEPLRGVTTVIHAAAETAGGWDAHQRNSIDATRHVLRAAAQAGVTRIVCVSSLAVLASRKRGAISEDTPLEPQSRGSGPYVWGKLESERVALALGEELGVHVKIVRPGAIVDYAAFEPPGRLGKGIGPLFVAVGSPRDRLGVVDLDFTVDTLAWFTEEFDAAPSVLNLIGPELPTKRELVSRLRRRNPDVRVVWLPRLLLMPLSALATGLQRLMRRGRPAVSLRKVFAVPRYDTARSHSVAERIAAWQNAGQSASGKP